MKIIALYLPQYHKVKENDDWWGKDYTEWTAVKKAKPLFKGHIQSKIPLNDDYYDLSDEKAETWTLQSKIAMRYGIYGFCIYHYWFETGKQLLEKPMEILLRHPEIEIKYFVSWANEDWTRAWYGLNTEMLMEQKYGDSKEWENHFKYLAQFFRDNRYIKIDNKPVIAIYHSKNILQLDEMVKVWSLLAKKEGYDGVYIISGNTAAEIDERNQCIDAYYNFEPGYTLVHKFNMIEKKLKSAKTHIVFLYDKLFAKSRIYTINDTREIYKHMDFISTQFSRKIYLGLFPSWDNTPRRSYKGSYYKNGSPQLFGEVLQHMNRTVGKEDFVFINAWNEWGEGCYLEPDNSSEYKYLEEILKTVKQIE